MQHLPQKGYVTHEEYISFRLAAQTACARGWRDRQSLELKERLIFKLGQLM